MQRIPAVDPTHAESKAKQLLDAVQAKLGVTPNMMKTFANSSAALEAYLNFSGALSHGTLGAKLGEKIALAVAQRNSCEYCLAAHSYIGEHMAKLKPEEVIDSREGISSDARTGAALRFAIELVDKRGAVSAQELSELKSAGFTDGEVAEIVCHVALNILTNYFNIAAQTEVDFPKVSLALPVPA